MPLDSPEIPLFTCKDCGFSTTALSLMPILYLSREDGVRVSTFKCPRCRGAVSPAFSIEDIARLRKRESEELNENQD